MKRTTIGLDIAKRVFQAHAVDSISGEVTRTKLRRSEVLSHFAQLQPSVIVMEACGSSQHWAREFCQARTRGQADRRAVRAPLHHGEQERRCRRQGDLDSSTTARNALCCDQD